MGFYLFNPRGRDHKRLFGADAFFDLDTTGPQAEQFKKISKGDACVVLSYTDAAKQQMLFATYRLDDVRSEMDPNRPGVLVHVLCGELKRADPMSKADAIRRHPTCFNKLGDLKQLAVL